MLFLVHHQLFLALFLNFLGTFRTHRWTTSPLTAWSPPSPLLRAGRLIYPRPSPPPLGLSMEGWKVSDRHYPLVAARRFHRSCRRAQRGEETSDFYKEKRGWAPKTTPVEWLGRKSRRKMGRQSRFWWLGAAERIFNFRPNLHPAARWNISHWKNSKL